MLTYPLENRNGIPIYEYLYRCLREDILNGVLAPGERLPSRRALAEHLRISVVTVENAYRQLEMEGYVIAKPRRGVYVSTEIRRPSGQNIPALSRNLSVQPDIVPDHANKTAVLTDHKTGTEFPADHRSETVWKLDLGSNRMDSSRFPSAVWAKLVRQILSEKQEALLMPIPHQGIAELREAVAAHLRSFKGMSVSPEQVIIGAGAEYLYLMLAQLLAPRNRFALEDPGYPKIRTVYRHCGAECVPIPLDGQGMNIDALYASGAAAAHLSPAHHYPVGLVTPLGRRLDLLRWADNTGGFLIEDDYDSEFRFTGRPVPTLQSIDHIGCVLYLNTFSQTISPAMRIGYLILPPVMLDRYRQKLGFYACTVPALEQLVLARFLRQGFFERHLARTRTACLVRRAAALEAFRNSPFADRISISEQAAGLHFLLRLDTPRTDEQIRQRGMERGVRLRFLSEYTAFSRPEFDHTLVVSYAGLSADTLNASMELLKEVFGF